MKNCAASDVFLADSRKQFTFLDFDENYSFLRAQSYLFLKFEKVKNYFFTFISDKHERKIEVSALLSFATETSLSFFKFVYADSASDRCAFR